MTLKTPPPLPHRTGVSGQYQATLDPARVPGAVALLMQERVLQEDWKGRTSQRLANAEAGVDELKKQDHTYDRLRSDERLLTEQRFAEVMQRIAIAETRVKVFLSTMIGVWSVITVLIGLWLAYAR